MARKRAAFCFWSEFTSKPKSDHHLLKVFCKTVMAVSRVFVRFSLSAEFRVCFVYEHEVYIDKEFRSTIVYQILVHYDEKILFDFFIKTCYI